MWIKSTSFNIRVRYFVWNFKGILYIRGLTVDGAMEGPQNSGSLFTKKTPPWCYGNPRYKHKTVWRPCQVYNADNTADVFLVNRGPGECLSVSIFVLEYGHGFVLNERQEVLVIFSFLRCNSYSKIQSWTDMFSNTSEKYITVCSMIGRNRGTSYPPWILWPRLLFEVKSFVCNHVNKPSTMRVITGDPLHSRALAHSRAPLFTQPCPGRTMSTAVCICRAVCKLPGSVEGHPW